MARAPVSAGYVSGGRTFTGGSPVGGYAGPSPAYASEATSMAELSNQINAMNRAAQQLANQQRIPNAPALEAQSSKVIGQQLLGEVPEDVMGLLRQESAERGVMTGMPGSPNVDAAYLRALGLTSIGQQKAGQESLTGAYARNPNAPIFDVSTQLTSPYQSEQLRLQRETRDAQLRFQREQLAQEAALAQARLQLEAQRMAQEAAFRSAAGAGPTQKAAGGGGGVPWYAQSEVPTAGDLFGYGRGTVSTETPTITPGLIKQTSEPSAYGVQPTSSGFMYVGPEAGYGSAQDEYINQLMEEFYAGE